MPLINCNNNNNNFIVSMTREEGIPLATGKLAKSRCFKHLESRYQLISNSCRRLVDISVNEIKKERKLKSVLFLNNAIYEVSSLLI